MTSGTDPAVKNPTDKLAEFLYLLMRDELPSGNVMRVVQQLEESRGLDVRYCSHHLANHARDIAMRILGDESQGQVMFSERVIVKKIRHLGGKNDHGTTEVTLEGTSSFSSHGDQRSRAEVVVSNRDLPGLMPFYLDSALYMKISR